MALLEEGNFRTVNTWQSCKNPCWL